MSSQNTRTKVSRLGLYYFQYLYKNEKEERGKGWMLPGLWIVMMLDFSYVLLARVTNWFSIGDFIIPLIEFLYHSLFVKLGASTENSVGVLLYLDWVVEEGMWY